VRRAVFLDRDGVISQLAFDAVDGRPESPSDPAAVALMPDAVEGIKAIVAAGFTIVVVSNQPAAAKGKTTPATLRAVHDRIVALLADDGVVISEWVYCFHHPDAVLPELRGPCDCRKPAPGMLTTAAARLGVDLPRSWMVGDSDADIAAGHAAGCRTVLVAHADSAHRRTGSVIPDGEARNLSAAVAFILREAQLASARK